MNDENQSNENSEGKQEEQTVAAEKIVNEGNGEKRPCEGGEEEVAPPAMEQSTPAAA